MSLFTIADAALRWTDLTQGYDGDTLRVKKTENGVSTYYLRSSVLGGQVVAELNWFSVAWGWSRGYVYGGYGLLAVQQDAQVRWVHEDPVTKTKRMTDANGAVISTIVFDPWGGAMGGPWSQNVWQQRRQFTTYERDGNESDEAMFRRYNRWHSRFDQPDPYDGSHDLTDPQSLNRYVYVQNDPVNFVDPSGLCPQGTTPATDPETGKTECVSNPSGSVTVTPDPWSYMIPSNSSGRGPIVITLLDGPRDEPRLPDVGPTRRNAETIRKAYYAAKLKACIKDAKDTYKKQKDEIANAFIGRAYLKDDISQATTLIGMLVAGRAEAKNLVGWASVKAAGKGALKSVPLTMAINVAAAYAQYAPQAIVYKQAYDEAIKSCYSLWG